VLFSEPKIPQFMLCSLYPIFYWSFSALQRAENSSITDTHRATPVCNRGFSALQRAENSSIGVGESRSDPALDVSVLFSEPKIPQSYTVSFNPDDFVSFSALQRAENSSMRFERRSTTRTACFSALQRAENSSILRGRRWLPVSIRFQCSSASRKFLNFTH